MLKYIRKEKFKIIYIGIGIMLTVLTILSSNEGLSDINYTLYEKSIEINKNIQREVWNGVNIKDYPVAIRNKDIEYVFYKGNVERREAVLPIYVCSVFDVNKRVNVLIPSYKELNNLGDIVEGISDGTQMMKSQFGFSKSSFSENQYIAILYHETFHAYQISHFIDKLVDISPFKDNRNKIDELINLIDNNKTLFSLYKVEGELLYRAVTAENKDDVVEYTLEYIEARNNRIEKLKNVLDVQLFELLMNIENYYELVEGTATYVQTRTLDVLNDREMYNQSLECLNDISKNKEKYYQSGMAICLVLERLSSDWEKDLFSQDKPLFDVLDEVITLNI